MVTGPEIRSGELCMFSKMITNSGGNWKSVAIDGKSLARFAGSSEGLSDDKERK
jgi:hypothetical protein